MARAVRLFSSFVLASLLGCGFDPAGRYAGDVDVRATVSRQTSPTDEAGRSTAETTSANVREDAVAILVTRVRDGVLSIQLGDFCELELEQPSNDARRASIDPLAEPECDVDAAGYAGPVRFGGTAQFTDHSLEVHLNGNIRAGPASGVGAIWGSYVYHARARRE
jgi:hypothetical protein